MYVSLFERDIHDFLKLVLDEIVNVSHLAAGRVFVSRRSKMPTDSSQVVRDVDLDDTFLALLDRGVDLVVPDRLL